MGHFFNDRVNRSSVADHLFEEGHDVDNLELSLIREINEPRLLNPWESLLIHINQDHVLNSDPGPLISSLFSIASEVNCKNMKF